MNTFIKRSMKLAVAIVFIGASVVPACAQKKGIIKGAKTALGKKPPLTGTAPVVKPVTPRVPPTLQGTAMPTRTAITENVLNSAVERAATQPVMSTPAVTYETVDLKQLITPNTPSWVPMSDIKLDNYDDDKAMNLLQMGKFRIAGVSANILFKLQETCMNADLVFFTEVNGKVFLKVFAVAYANSYEEVLKTIFPKEEIFNKIWASSQLQEFIKMRNKQIADALKAANNIGAPQFKGIPQADVTTQRTAEEIQSLVENLAPENPLRQAIEGTLKDNGYIAPAE